MLSQKELVLRAAKRALHLKRNVPRDFAKRGRPFCRYLSSVSPQQMHEEDDDAKDTWDKKSTSMPLKPKANAMEREGRKSPRAMMEEQSMTGIAESFERQKDKTSSPANLTYTGNATMPITSHLHIFTPEEDAPRGIWPVFRMMVSTKTGFSKCLVELKHRYPW